MKFKFPFLLLCVAVSAIALGCSVNLSDSLQSSVSDKDASVTYGNGGGVIKNGSASAATIKKTISIDKFSSIEASNAIQIVLVPGKFDGKAQIATTESAEPYLKVDVVNGCLRARYQGTFRQINGPSIITVKAEWVDHVELSSAASFEVQGNISGEKISFDLSSAGKVTMQDVKCKSFDAELSSASNLNVLKLSSPDISIDTSSAAHADIKSVVGINKAELEASSAAKISIGEFTSSSKSNETGLLDAEVSSGASINVKNATCRKIKAEASSGAKVTVQTLCAMIIEKETSSGGSVNLEK